MKLPAIERTLQKTFQWIKEIQEELGTDNERMAWHALRSVLHHLRDRLTVNEAVQLAAELPMLIRGLYYEGWRPSIVPIKIRHREEFLDLIRRDFPRNPDVDPEKIARAVWNVMKRHIASGELEDILSLLPKEIREIFEGES